MTSASVNASIASAEFRAAGTDISERRRSGVSRGPLIDLAAGPETIGVAGLKALRSVLPEGTLLWPVGGVTPQSLAPWLAAGATGFGIGGQLFQAGKSLADVADTARAFVAAWAAAAPTAR